MDPSNQGSVVEQNDIGRSTQEAVGSWATRLSLRLGRLLEVLIGALVAIAVVATFSQVVFRYFLAIPLHWVEELARYVVVWVVLVGAALGFRSAAHFRLQFVLDWLPPAVHRIGDQLIDVVTAAFLIVFLAAAIPLLPIALNQTAPGLGISLFWFYLALPVGAALMITFLVIGIATGSHEPLPREARDLAQNEVAAGVE